MALTKGVPVVLGPFESNEHTTAHGSPLQESYSWKSVLSMETVNQNQVCLWIYHLVEFFSYESGEVVHKYFLNS